MRRGEWVLLAQWVEPYLDLDAPAARGDRELVLAKLDQEQILKRTVLVTLS